MIQFDEHTFQRGWFNYFEVLVFRFFDPQVALEFFRKSNRNSIRIGCGSGVHGRYKPWNSMEAENEVLQKMEDFSFGKIPSFSSSKRSTFQESKFGHSQDPFKLKHETKSESEMLGGVRCFFWEPKSGNRYIRCSKEHVFFDDRG